MAIYRNGWTVFGLVVTLVILETVNFVGFSSQVFPVHHEEEQFLPHTREKRNAPTNQWDYIVDVVLNPSDVATLEQLRFALNASTLPIQLDNNTEISDISITTVCSSTANGSQCRCEEHFAWPYITCDTYETCDYTSSGICTCINAIPADGQSCLPISELLVQFEYEVDVELNVSNIETVDNLRLLLDTGGFSLALGPAVNVTHIDITTVCYPNGTNFQCRCEEQYVWSYGSCITYGACDEITDETCGCINGIPANGEYCKPKEEAVQLYEYIIEVEISIVDIALIERLRDAVEITIFPIQLSNTINITQIDIIFTGLPVFYEYLVFIEVNTTGADQLRNTLTNIQFPVQISTRVNISEAYITTVCSQNDTAVQCRCEDDYLWPCEKCATYGKCDGDTNNTCGCINAIPTDGQYCQSVYLQNLTACLLTTTAPSTASPVVYGYLISVELNISDATLINQLRTILRNISYPVNINSQIQIYDVNISTVCSPSNGGYQCTCEDQYRWSCDQCFLYGYCDSITDDTCGCINGIPPDGRYCQPADQYNFTACPLTTPSPSPTTPAVFYEYEISVELNISDAAKVNQLKTNLRNISYPISIGQQVQFSDINISTVCSPSSGGYQCTCEDQYRWPCDQCFLYGYCDSITDDTCGCINGIPPDGGYCQPADQYNFTSCPLTTTTATPSSTTPPALHEYLISVELNISDVTLINQLRTILRNISFPISINNNIQIYDVNISTVCSPSSGDYQCTCEDQYRWPCDQCFLYGYCDNITDDTCGCINGIPPDGRYCQPADQYNFTACPVTTPSPPPTAPPAVHSYMISVELNISDVTLINQLRTILNNISYPISINEHIQIYDVNMTTVCSPNGTTFQCKCEEQYQWPCHMCNTFGTCDDIIDNTCGCINAIPPDGVYCQALSELYFCPSPTPPNATTTVATTQSTTTILTPTPTVITDTTLYSTAEPNITTAATTPITVVTNTTLYSTAEPNITTAATTPMTVVTITDTTLYSTAEPNITTAATTPMTVVTNSTPVATTDMTTTTAVTPTEITTYSTTVAPTSVNTTTVNTTPTTVTNSTPIPTTHQNTTTPLNPPTTVVTNSTPVVTTATTPTTIIVTNFTTVATTVATTNVDSTTPTRTPTTVTDSTPFDTPTTPPKTTVTTAPTTTATTPTIAPTTAATTKTTTTTTTIPTTASTTVATAIPTTTTSPPDSSTLSTTRAPSSPTIPTPTVPGLKVEMSVEFDLEFKPGYSDSTSAEYQDLERRVNSVLQEQYKGITGFINAFVTGFREGSVIAEFIVQTTQVDSSQVAEVNNNLTDAMKAIAPVLKVSAHYNSPRSLSFPDLTYTGKPMKLTCEPAENFNVGEISGSKWKKIGEGDIRESERISVSTSSKKSVLEIKNVILADIGRYECTLTSKEVNFRQRGDVTNVNIKAAPVLQLKRNINVKCDGTDGQKQPIRCCVQKPYKVKWFRLNSPLVSSVDEDSAETFCRTYEYNLEGCSESQPISFKCKVEDLQVSETTTLTIFKEGGKCNKDPYGDGKVGDISEIECDSGQEGSKTAVCQETGEWKLQKDTCIIVQVKELLIVSEDLVKEEVPAFVANLSETVKEEKSKIANSSATISAIVDILNNIANVSSAGVSEAVIQDVLETVDAIVGDDSRESWEVLNSNGSHSASSELLLSLENLSEGLDGEIAFETERIHLNRAPFDNSFRADLNNSIVLDIPDTNLSNVFITTMIFSTLNNVLPARNSSFDTSLLNGTINDTVTDNAINAAVVLVKINATIQNVTLSYDKLNMSLSLNPQCVFWNFTLFDNLGGWDDEGCTFVSDINDTVKCNCNHLTSFSILMATNIPPELRKVLDVITYVGVGISLASLVICLIIEGYVWKAITRNSTAFMRHVSIINTALSLLIANICFIIAASIAKNPLENPGENYEVPKGPCSTATFFMHFFYLALFFWMLVSGLLLFYRTVMVFSHMSKSTMLAIGFTLGYGGPLIIAIITVAVTAPSNGYIRKDFACWLNWLETKALLAMVIPALTIVFINIIIVFVVLFKMLRRGVGDTAQADEKHTLVVILRCVVILTPLFGLTWSLGVGTMISSTNQGIHIAFAFFNSLQGFFILVFGTLFDSKIRSLLSRRLPTSSTGSGSNPTRSTSGGISSLSGLSWISRLRGRRYVYHLSEAANSSSNGASESFSNI
ncbi:uncharacterized protein LOC131991519 [Centropristis striata]|uniref:uncharacterized protein LOC131991519 n=1 Tax=Centropristis striata TaxID=184440 RepID=UPI0027E19799|nr:uncharacterized protein LOC131991519 [Centropristis striata]